MVIEASNLVNSLVEVKKKGIVDVKVVVRMISNLFKETFGSRPVDNELEVWGDHIRLNIIRFLPGMKVVSGGIETDEFERRYLKPLGWTIDYAQYNRSHHYYSLNLESVGNILEKKPKNLYHAAPTIYKHSILEKGLKPRSRPYNSTFRYLEPRVYFLTALDFRTLKDMISDKGDVVSYMVFRLDTDKFDRFNLFEDSSSEGDEGAPGFPLSVYTLTHIPGKHLELIAWFNDGEIIRY